MKTPASAKFALMHFVQPLEKRPGFATRPMFGCLAVYLDEINVIVLAEKAGTKEWNGLLVPTDRAHHESLRAEFPCLEPHPVLGKWLYVPQSHGDFEAAFEGIVAAIRRGDARVGVESATAGRRRGTGKPKPFMNLGPRCREAMDAAGIRREADLKKLGWKKALEKTVTRAGPQWINLNFAVALRGAIEQRDWREYGADAKAPMKAWLDRLRKAQRAAKPARRDTRKKIPVK